MSHKDRSHVKIDKTVISTAPLFDKSDLKHYWHSRSPQERLEYMEMLRAYPKTPNALNVMKAQDK